MDPDITAVDHPEPLTHKPVVITAADYFAILEVQKPDVPYPKNNGEPGRRPGKSHKGYVQVNKYILSIMLLVLMIWNS